MLSNEHGQLDSGKFRLSMVYSLNSGVDTISVFDTTHGIAKISLVFEE
jgi:hypothetical protein